LHVRYPAETVIAQLLCCSNFKAVHAFFLLVAFYFSIVYYFASF
jgi:hypothetical protein